MDGGIGTFAIGKGFSCKPWEKTMNELKNTKKAESSPDRGDIRTLQALDQAAGGSGDIVPEQQARPSSAPSTGPERGTDDARCEDSVERDRWRKQTVDEVSFGISHPKAASRFDDAHEEAASDVPAPDQERTDAEIRSEIEGRLQEDRLLDETSIFVTVSRGRVLIEGSVDNHEAKQRAEAISRQATGIVGHDSNLAIRKAP